MKKTVAIVGSHPKTSKDFNFDRTDCDVWVFNEALNTDWCKRADGVFQIHQPVIWRSRTNRNDPGHYDWLQAQTESIIYMIDQFEDVPKSEKYPLDEIKEKYPTSRKYYTSSVAYALALAIYKGYTKIEVYGVEMETNTEYGHQRVGVAYWIGFADGLGINVDFHGSIFDAPLYGYDGDVKIPVEYFVERVNKLSPHAQGAYEQTTKLHEMMQDKMQSFIKSYKTDLTDLDEIVIAFGQNSYNTGLMNGASSLVESFMKKCYKMEEESGTYLIVRQEFEGAMQGAGKGIPKANEAVHRVGIELKEARQRLNTNDNREIRKRLANEFMQILAKYQYSTHELGKLSGVVKESQLVMKEYDLLLKASGLSEEPTELVKADTQERIKVLA